MKPKIALQLWSVQNECQNDFLHTLKQVKEFGYDGVEFAGYYGHTSHEIKEAVTELDLEIAGSHIPYENLRDHLEETLDFEQKIGNQRIIIPYANFSTLAEWESFIGEMNKISQAVTNRGMSLFYHNHDHEFTEFPNMDLLDLLVHKTENLQLEVDLYWLAHAKICVSTWMEEQKEAIGLLHIKDKQMNPEESTELGNGILPLTDYVHYAKNLNLPWLIIEQEAFQKFSPIESAKQNRKSLKKIIDEVYQ